MNIGLWRRVSSCSSFTYSFFSSKMLYRRHKMLEIQDSTPKNSIMLRWRLGGISVRVMLIICTKAIKRVAMLLSLSGRSGSEKNMDKFRVFRMINGKYTVKKVGVGLFWTGMWKCAELKLMKLNFCNSMILSRICVDFFSSWRFLSLLGFWDSFYFIRISFFRFLCIFSCSLASSMLWYFLKDFYFRFGMN